MNAGAIEETSAQVSRLLRHAGAALTVFFSGGAGFESRQTRSAWLAISGDRATGMNCLTVHAPGPDVAEAIGEWLSVMQSRGLPGQLIAAPATAPMVAAIADGFGLPEGPREPFMVRGREALAPLPVDRTFPVTRVGSPAPLPGAAAALAAAFGFEPGFARSLIDARLLAEPGMAVDVVSIAGQVASTALTYRAGSVVYLTIMGTDPAFQRRGAGLALMDGVLRRHLDEGVEMFHLMASEAGRALYARLGFRLLAETSSWVIASDAARDRPR